MRRRDLYLLLERGNGLSLFDFKRSNGGLLLREREMNGQEDLPRKLGVLAFLWIIWKKSRNWWWSWRRSGEDNFFLSCFPKYFYQTRE
jgi:hypothetical protein